MAATNNTTTASVHGSIPDLEKNTTPQSTPDHPSNGIPDNLEKTEDTGPPDGGSAAWLVLLGAWCCSFSSPGWINSTLVRIITVLS